MNAHPSSIFGIEGDLFVILQEIAANLRKSIHTLAVAEDGFTGGLLLAALATTCDSTLLRRGWLVQDEQSMVKN